jgi:hypothetical protein
MEDCLTASQDFVKCLLRIGQFPSSAKFSPGEVLLTYSITGNAEKSQLEEIAELTLGDGFDGTKDLWAAFANAKGNN